MNEYRVKITVRNNLLMSAIEEAGYKTQADFAKALGVKPTAVNNLVAMREAPITSEGEFSEMAKLVMEALGACPTDLWTEQQLTMKLRKNSADMKMGASTLQLMMADPNDPMLLETDVDDMNLFREELKDTMDNMLDSLTPREAKALKLRYGIGCEAHTLEDAGKTFGITRERMRQIEAKALRKLRSPSRSDNLKPFIDPDGYESSTVRGNRCAPSLEVMKKRYGHTPETTRHYQNEYMQWTKDVVEAAKITQEAREKLKN
jgi:RNA polymerase sigma factor (sigma-70 family)